MRCRGGTPTLKLVTATGCSVTALIAAFLVANPEDRVFAAAAALSVFGCAHIAHTSTRSSVLITQACLIINSGSFEPAF